MPMPDQLNSIGMNVFLQEYEYFASRPHHTDAVKYLIDKGICNKGGAGWRAKAAEKLFENPLLLRETLEYIIHISRRATEPQKEKAKRLLSEL